MWSLFLGIHLLGAACDRNLDHAPGSPDDVIAVARAAVTSAVFYVSPAGSGSVCSVSQPCSLQTAQTKVRAATPSMTGDLVVRLLGGTYPLTSPLSLDVAAGDGATGASRVIYEANPGAHPVLSGGLPVSGWTPVSGTTQWRAAVPAGFDTRQLYVNGVRAVRAQGTAPGTLTQTVNGYINTGTTTMASWGNPQNIEFVYEVGFESIRCGVDGISGGVITMKQPCYGNSTRPGRSTANGYSVTIPTFVENARELLDQPGEWYLDRSANAIFYIPRSGESLATAVVMAARDGLLLQATGAASAPLRNLTIRGLTFSYAGWTEPNGGDGFSEVQANHRLVGTGAGQTQGTCNRVTPAGSCPVGAWTAIPASVAFSRTDGLSLERNTFTHLGAAGLQIGVGAARTTVAGNVFQDISGNGMQIGDVLADLSTPVGDLPSATTVVDNLFTNVAVEYASGVGLFQGYTRQSLIQHNQVNDVTYSGISSGWGWGFQSSLTQGNVIRANLVFDHLRQRPNGGGGLSDGGGIYTLGDQGPGPAPAFVGSLSAGSTPPLQTTTFALNYNNGGTIDYNYIHGQGRSAHSIYVDAGSQFVAVNDNVEFDNQLGSGGGGSNADFGGCGPAGDMLVFDNWWQTPPNWGCNASPANVTTDGSNRDLLSFNTAVPGVSNLLVSSVNDTPGVIRETAGLEASFEDIRLGPASGFNLAYRKPVTALFMDGTTAAMQPGSEPESAVDGDPTSYAQATSRYQWQVQIDLLDLQDIDRVRITMPSAAFATSLHIATSASAAGPFTTIATRSGLASGMTDITFPPIFTRYVRVVADQPSGPNQPGGQMALAEVGVYGPPDLALHKTTVAQYADGTPAKMQVGKLPSLAVDGIASTFAQATSQYRWQLIVDLGIARLLTGAIITMPADRFATQFHVDTSTDDATWSLAATVGNGAGGTRSIALSVPMARYVRVVADKPDAAGQTGGQMAINRFSVYGDTNFAMGSVASAQFIDGSVAAMQPFGDSANAIDGNAATWAQATGQYLWRLTLDLGASKTVGEVDVLMPAAAFATAFQVDTFDATQTTRLSTQVVSLVAVGGLVQVVLPTAVINARFVRIEAQLPNGPSQRGGQMGIAEVIVTR